MTKRTRVQLILGVEPPVRGSDLAAHMAFLRGWALEDYTTRSLREGQLYLVSLTVPDDWGPSDGDDFGTELTRALELMRGMPWLGVREVLAYMAADHAVQQVQDEQASEMFALLRRTDKAGWGEIVKPVLDKIRPYTDHAGKQVAGTAAVAALKALGNLLGFPTP